MRKQPTVEENCLLLTWRMKHWKGEEKLTQDMTSALAFQLLKSPMSAADCRVNIVKISGHEIKWDEEELSRKVNKRRIKHDSYATT